VTEYISVQESNIRFELVIYQLESAKTCENYAHKKPAKADWLESCNQALSNPKLNSQNRSIVRFNQALILDNLNKRDEAKQKLKTLIKDDPNFGEADYELARLAYLESDYPAAIDYATSALSKEMERKSRAYHIIGSAYEKDFHFTSARQAYEAGLQKNSGDGYVRRSLERLNRLWPKKSPTPKDTPS